MYLFIDASELNVIELALFDVAQIRAFRVEAKNRDLLRVIEEFFSKEKFLKGNLRGLMVVVGAGSFTSTRISTTVANSFAYVLQIPVLAISRDQKAGIQGFIPRLLSTQPGQFVSATYSGEANIGIKKEKK